MPLERRASPTLTSSFLFLAGLAVFGPAARGVEAAEAAPTPAGASSPKGLQAKAGPRGAGGRGGAAAASAAEVTLQGTLMCAKCGLRETTTCQRVLVVEEGGKDVKYFLANNAVSDAQHEKVCGRTVPATVTGTVSEEKGKKTITAATVTTK